MILQEDILQRQFGDACRSGDIEAVESPLDRGALINQVRHNGATPFWVACYQGHRGVVELLLERNLATNVTNI